jgi:hypothetical protein
VTNHFDHWQRRMAGEDVGCKDGEPQAGYYRNRTDPVAIWFDDAAGALVAVVGTREITDHTAICRLWDFCHAQPIAYEVYVAVAERGEPWPDQHPAVVKAEAVTGYDALAAEVERLFGEASVLIEAGAATTADQADRAAHLTDALSKLEKQADTDRRAEKKPHEDAAKAVDQRWFPVRDRAAEAKRSLKGVVIEPWLKAKARAEAEARAKVGDLAVGEPVKASTRGGRVALRSVRVTTVTDIRLALRWFAERNEDVPEALVEVVQRLAKGFAEVDVVVPGTETRVEQKAA